MVSTYPLTVDSFDTHVDNVDDVMAADVNDLGLSVVALQTAHRDYSLMRVKNTSGSTVAANDVGYTDGAGEFKLNTTDFRDGVNWAVVVEGAANNADIIVTNKGLVTVVCNGNVSIGDFLYMSTTTKQVQPQSYVRPEVMAVAKTANASGAGGTCVALLHCFTRRVGVSSSNNILYVNSHAENDFVSTIATLPGGAVLTYAAVTSGAENTIAPIAATELGKLRLYNSTRSTYGLIDSVVVGTNTINLTANVPGAWQVGDTITLRSPTTVFSAPPPYFYEVDLSSADNTAVPVLARALVMDAGAKDTGGTGDYLLTHPWETYAGSKEKANRIYLANVYHYRQVEVSLFQRRFSYMAGASGAATKTTVFRLDAYDLATP